MMNSLIKKIIYKYFSSDLNKISTFKKKHAGESCYIFGDGVSIKWFDLNVFPKKITFSLNKFLMHNDASNLNIKYHLELEPYYFYPYYKSPPNFKNKWIKNRVKDEILHYTRKHNISLFTSLTNYPILRDNNFYFLFNNLSDDKFNFLKECKKEKINIFSGVLRAAVFLAIYMGFNEIILVGCDYTHKHSKSRHWYDKGKGINTSHTNYQKKFFEIALKYSKIITITTYGGGNILKGVPYSKYTGHNLNFKENYELLDKNSLDILHSHGHKIF